MTTIHADEFVIRSVLFWQEPAASSWRGPRASVGSVPGANLQGRGSAHHGCRTNGQDVKGHRSLSLHRPLRSGDLRWAAGTIITLNTAQVRPLACEVSSACVSAQGNTSVASATNRPVWNEEISFIEQFPPLAQRIRIQLLDDAKMGDVALATHFLDLQQISDPTRNGTTGSFIKPQTS